MASRVVGKVDSYRSWSGAKEAWQRDLVWWRKAAKKEGRKKEGEGVVVWILASLVLDYLLGVMVRVSRFVSDGVLRGLAWCVGDAAV